jgi:hypothetical protein
LTRAWALSEERRATEFDQPMLKSHLWLPRLNYEESIFLQYVDLAQMLLGLGNFVAQLEGHLKGALILLCLFIVWYHRAKGPPAL